MSRPPPEETFNDPLTPALRVSIEHVAHLVLALECERPLAGSARYSLAGCDEVVIGRGTERTAIRDVDGRTRRLTVTVPDRRMSSAHGRLWWNGARWIYEDTQSKNGSMVNGRPALKAAVAESDLFQLGHTLFFVREDLPTPPGTLEDVDAGDLANHALGFRTLVPVLADELSALMKVARSRVSVLLLGETGTGKEVLARAIHTLARPRGDLVAVNCGALPEALVESQLFGHVKGAFSGAVRDEPGFVRAADGGTLFLDEIGDLAKPSQAALLRVLQEREVVPVGATRPHPVDVRVIAATHRPLTELAARGEFRSDLLARLGGLTFSIPPLRERREDIGLLLADLLPRGGQVPSIEPEAARALLSYEWPHNVRELEKVLSLVTVLADGGALRAAHLPASLTNALHGSAPPAVPDEDEEIEDVQLRTRLLAHLETQRGNVSEVARLMGKARPQIHRWLKRLRIDPKVYRG